MLESISPNYPTKEGALLRVVRVELAVIVIDTSQPTIIIGPRLITVTVSVRASNEGPHEGSPILPSTRAFSWLKVANITFTFI